MILSEMAESDSAKSKIFICDTCDRQFARLEHLNRHKRRHTKEKPYTCVCGKSFTRRDLLTRHDRLVHHDDEQVDRAQDNLSSKADQVSGIEQELPGFPNSRHPWTTDLEMSLTPTETLYDGDLSQLQMFQEFTTFVDTVGFLGMDLADNTLNFPQYSSHNSISLDRRSRDQIESHQHKPDIEGDIPDLKPLVCPYRVPEDLRQFIVRELEVASSNSDALPSRIALARYVTGYFGEFQHHLPIIHVASFDVSSTCIKYPELLMIIAAIGAVYRFRQTDARFLFKAAQNLVVRRWRIGNSSGSTYTPILQTLVLLKFFTIWQQKPLDFQGDTSVHTLLLEWVRRYQPPEQSTIVGIDWSSWTQQESATRSYLAAFCVFNMHSSLHQVSPELSNSMVKSNLPCSTALWNAESAEKWLLLATKEATVLTFQGALMQLFSSGENLVSTSPFGCFVLLQAIIQRIHFSRQISLDGILRSSDNEEFERALDRWKNVWKRAPEAILNPSSSDASISFQSMSYLTLAYLRLGRDVFPPLLQLAANRMTKTINGSHSATSVGLSRNDWSFHALLHSSHALMIVVRVGIDYVRRTLAFHWDPQHFMCWVESALCLSRWLTIAATTCAQQPLNEMEQGIIRWVGRIINEALPSLDITDYDSICESVTSSDIGMDVRLRALSFGVLSTWSQVLSKSNNPWPVGEVAGDLLAMYKDAMR